MHPVGIHTMHHHTAKQKRDTHMRAPQMLKAACQGALTHNSAGLAFSQRATLSHSHRAKEVRPPLAHCAPRVPRSRPPTALPPSSWKLLASSCKQVPLIATFVGAPTRITHCDRGAYRGAYQGAYQGA